MVAPPLPARPSASFTAETSTSELVGFERDRARWLIRIRWWVLGTAALALAITTVLDVLDRPGPIWLVLLGAAGANFGFELVRRSSADVTKRLITAQIILDLAVLSQVLYWGGGLESPFGIFFVFPMAVAGMLLPLRRAITLAALSVTLHGGTLVAEATGLIPHRPINLGAHAEHDAIADAVLWHTPGYVITYLLALALAEVGIAWFVAILFRRLRETEDRRIEHERVARSRERLARIGTLASGVAHTVRNPLHGLLNCVDMLERRSDDDEGTRELIELMSEGVSRIDTVTRRLLNLTHEGPMERLSTQPSALVEDAVRFARVAARDRDVHIATDVGHADPLPLGADRMMEALVNVIENAVQASGPRQEVRVRLRTEDLLGDRRLVIEVADGGAGIPEDHLDRIFDPFFTTKPVGEGSGLGLAIARHAVDAHDGELEVESRPGRGTRVRMSVPYPPGKTA